MWLEKGTPGWLVCSGGGGGERTGKEMVEEGEWGSTRRGVLFFGAREGEGYFRGKKKKECALKRNSISRGVPLEGVCLIYLGVPS